MTETHELNELLHLVDGERIDFGDLADELPERMERKRNERAVTPSCARCGRDVGLPDAELCEACHDYTTRTQHKR
jgi:hypothetical protein